MAPEHSLVGLANSATFLVEVDGVAIGRYSEVFGLEVEVEMVTYREGGVNGFAHQLPGRMRWPNIVLKRGVSNDDHLLAWFHRASGEGFASGGKVERTTAAVTLVDRKGDRLRAWELIDAVPVRWTGPTLASQSSSAATEELEVAHHGFKSRAY